MTFGALRRERSRLQPEVPVHGIIWHACTGTGTGTALALALALALLLTVMLTAMSALALSVKAAMLEADLRHAFRWEDGQGRLRWWSVERVGQVRGQDGMEGDGRGGGGMASSSVAGVPVEEGGLRG